MIHKGHMYNTYQCASTESMKYLVLIKICPNLTIIHCMHSMVWHECIQ